MTKFNANGLCEGTSHLQSGKGWFLFHLHRQQASEQSAHHNANWKHCDGNEQRRNENKIMTNITSLSIMIFFFLLHRATKEMKAAGNLVCANRSLANNSAWMKLKKMGYKHVSNFFTNHACATSVFSPPQPAACVIFFRLSGSSKAAVGRVCTSTEFQPSTSFMVYCTS